MTYSGVYLLETWDIISKLDPAKIEAVVDELVQLRERNGRLFVLGLGGSAAHASHAVNDLRKIARIEAYAPTDNVAELTAWINDESWEKCFERYLETSYFERRDALLIFSVGGGQMGVSAPIGHAIDYARHRSATVLGIVGRDGGFTSSFADAYVHIPPCYPERITPHTEGIAAVVWHLIVSHPELAA